MYSSNPQQIGSLPIVESTPINLPAGYQKQQQRQQQNSTEFPSTVPRYDDSLAADPPLYPSDSVEVMKGEPQPPKYNDVFFAILFIAMIGVFCYLAAAYAPLAFTTLEDVELKMNFFALLYATLILCAFAGVISVLSMSFMQRHASSLITITLVGGIILQFVVGIVILVFSGQVMGFIWIIFGFIGVCYYFWVQSRIPFATANLKCGLAGIRNNGGLGLVAYGLTLLGAGWSVLWFTILIGITAASNDDEGNNNNDKNDGERIDGAVLFALLVGFYWVHQVLSNIVHTTTAGVV
jgi:hypothetical protein